MAPDMNIRAASLALVVSVLACGGEVTAQTSQPSTDSDAARVADEATKDVKFDPNGVKLPVMDMSLQTVPAVKSEEPLTPDPAAEVEALKLSPYIVRDLPNRVYERATEAIAQQHRLQTYAVYKKEVSTAVRFEFLNPPEPGTNGKANFPLLRFSW